MSLTRLPLSLTRLSMISEHSQNSYLIQEYRRWNVCIGGVLFFLLFFMTAAVCLLQKSCPLFQRTGNPCLLCGCTRDFLLILHGKNAIHNPISFPLFIGLLMEFCWRIAICLVPAKIMKWCLISDVLWHIIWGIVLVVAVSVH